MYFLLSSYNNQSSIDKSMPPALVIGTKLDEAQKVRESSTLRIASPIANECRFDEINLVI